MPKGKEKYLPIPALLIDAILLFNAFLTADYFIFKGHFPDPIFYYALFIGWFVLWVIIALFYKIYDLPRVFFIDQQIKKNMNALVMFTLISAALLYFITDYKFSKSFFILAIVIFAFMLMAWHTMLIILFKAYRLKGNNFRTAIVVGLKSPIEKLINDVLLVPEHGYKLKGVFGDFEEISNNNLHSLIKGKEDELLPFLEENQIDEMFIALPGHKSKLINTYMSYADNHMIRVHILPNFSSYLFQRFEINYIQSIPTLKLRKEPLESLSNRMLKRLFDIIFSVFVLVVIGVWLFPIIAIIIKATSKGPILFKQQRSGKDGEIFYCLKFRSMTINKNADTLQATKNDSRITKIGKFLRKSSLDEFPQFINVLMNHMSVVGPRPHMLKHTDEYQKIVHKFMVRHYAKPGITGWAQIKGFRGETKKVKDMENRAEADIWYVENWNFFLDIKIIILTIWRVVFKKEENAF